MSPSESDLRSFLHDGEGEPVSPDAVITHARAVRHTRRVRLASVAAAVVVAGGVGTGALLANHDSSGSTSSAAGRADSAAQASDSRSSGMSIPGNPTPTTAAAGSACPASPLRLNRPSVSGAGPLFDGSVTSMQICGYTGGLPGSAQLGGSSSIAGTQARQLAASLNDAPTKADRRNCTAEASERILVIYASTSVGPSQPVVVDYGSCHRLATNGAAVRYDWTPPANLGPMLTALITAHPNGSTSPSFKPSGSPVR